MKVLLVTAMVAGGVGGHVRMLARGLVEAGHRVVVACPAEVGERFGLARTGAVVVPVEVGSGLRPVQDLRAVRTLRRLAAGADVVHAHGMRAGALAVLARGPGAGRRVARLRGRLPTLQPHPSEVGAGRPPLVVTVHNAPPTGRRSSLVYELLERVVHAGADLVLGVSPDLVERAGAQGARQVDLAVVPADLTGAVLPAGRPGVRAQIRHRLEIEDGQLLLLTVGRLGAQKRTDEVLLAYQALFAGPAPSPAHGSPPARASASAPAPSPEQRPEGVVLAVVGDGPELGALQQLAADGPGEVHLLGRRDDVAELLAAADVVVSAARWEGQPLWLQEALGAGAPIVATDVGGTGVVVGEAARLVRVGDGTGPGAVRARVETLRDALQEVLGDAGLRADLSDRALRRAGQLPSASEAVTAALEAYARAGGTTYRDRPGNPGRT